RRRPGAPAGGRRRLPAVRPGRAGAVSDGVLGVGQPAERREPFQGRGGWPYPLPAPGRRPRRARRGWRFASRAAFRRRVPGLVCGTRPGDAPDRRSPARPRPLTDARHRASSDRPGRTGSV
ncbi:MAG: Transcriptional regulator, AcrR family, partial [uncultured Rubrobacteraceae bacterium]